MPSIVQRAVRGLVLAFALAIMSLSPQAMAHENHEELGAGPGPAKAAATIEDGAQTAGAADAHAEMAMDHEMAMEAHTEAAGQNKSLGERLVSWLGRAHMLVVHFPIAMFVGAFGVELFGKWRGHRNYDQAVQVMLMVGAIGAVIAAFLGWFSGGFYLTDRNPVLMIHRWLGTAIALAGILLLYLAASARRAPEKPRTAYWVALGILTMAIAVQGYLGGSFMHGGMDHMAF